MVGLILAGRLKLGYRHIHADEPDRCLPLATRKERTGDQRYDELLAPGHGGLTGRDGGIYPPLPPWSRPITRGQQRRAVAPTSNGNHSTGCNQCHSTNNALLRRARPTASSIRR